MADEFAKIMAGEETTTIESGKGLKVENKGKGAMGHCRVERRSRTRSGMAVCGVVR
jgi:hypothetical protein